MLGSIPDFLKFSRILIPMSSGSLVRARKLRTDIQALRTIAVSLVVVFHLWPNRLAGGFIGVDVFFVISGFLITKHLLHEVENQKFSITAFWSRRIKRLLPASFLVLFVTGLLTVLLVPLSRWAQWLGELQASIFYFENWNLAFASVDYLALDNQASPFQHFWSLSTEEQFYFVWPLLIALAISAGALHGRRRSILLILLTVTLASLCFSIFYTAVEPAIAYFSTPVRAWEFGVGALIAFIPKIKLEKWQNLIALVGVATILASGFLFNTKIPFPGWVALLPVLGTALVIVAAVESGFISRLFSLRPIQWVGDKSYAIYLWHWPLIILAPYLMNGALPSIAKALVLVMTVVLSWLTQVLVEQRVATLIIDRWRIFALAATSSVLIAALAGIAILASSQQIEAELKYGKSGAVAAQPCFGADARISQNCQVSNIKGLFPSLSVAASDTPVLPDKCFSVSREQIEASFCELGDANSSIRIAAIGDSHLAQYAGAINAMALQRKWKIDLYAKGGCPFTYAVRVHDQLLTKNCPAWVNNVVREVKSRDYDTIITSQRAGVEWVGGQKVAVSGLEKLWNELVASGEKIVVIKDNPSSGEKIIDCLRSGAKCLIAKSEALKFDPQVLSASSVEAVRLLDMDDIFCDQSKCLPVIGNVVVYRDDNHLTDTFARTLAPMIAPEIVATLNQH